MSARHLVKAVVTCLGTAWIVDQQKWETLATILFHSLVLAIPFYAAEDVAPTGIESKML